MQLKLKQENDKIGFINESSEIVIPIKFKHHYGFDTEVKLLKINNEYHIFVKQKGDRYYYNLKHNDEDYIENCVIYQYSKIIFIVSDECMMYIYSNIGELLISGELNVNSNYEIVLNDLLTSLLIKAMRKDKIKSFLV